MVKIFIMTSGTFFVGDLEDVDGTGDPEKQVLKGVLEIKFVEKVVKTPPPEGAPKGTPTKEELVMAPDFFPVGYPMNTKAKDIQFSKILAESWFELDTTLPLKLIEWYHETARQYNSQIIQTGRKSGIIY
jgi:hypothetical protein